VNKVTLGSSSSSVPSSGGSVSLFAVVVDPDGNPVAGVPVVFTTTAGTLAATSVPTDSTGRATTTLTTSSTAQVTATAGTVSSSALTITAAAKPTVTVTASTTSPAVGQPVAFTVSVTPSSGTTGAAIRNVVINFGDGKSTSLGTTGGSASNTYGSPGTYTVSATATDANGETATATTILVVNPVTLGLTASPTSGAPPLTVSFTLSVNPSTAAIASVDWDFGDGDPPVTGTSQLTINHVYVRSAVWTATATVHFVGGGSQKVQTTIRAIS
jgi:PKD repeat protein